MKSPKLAIASLTLGAAGLGFISGNEGRVYQAYLDPVAVVTICDGHTKTAKLGQVATDEVCDHLLKQDTAEAEAAVKRLVKVPVTQKQYIALVDFTFNLGTGSLRSSTLLRRVNEGNCWAAGSEFPKWKYARGVELRGLLKRRNAERALWETGC